MFLERINSRLLGIIAISISFLGCSTNHRLDFSVESQLCQLKSKDIYMSGPLDMEIDSCHIYVSSYRGDSLLWTFDKHSLEEVGHFLPRGNGPCDFDGPIQFFINDTLITVHNRWHYEIKELNIKDGIVQFQETPVINRISTDIDMICPFSDSLFIATGRFSESRFAIFDRDRIMDYFGDYPSYKDGETEIPNFPKFMFHQSMISYNQKNNNLLAATSHVIDIWSMDLPPKLKTRILLSDYDYQYDYGDGWASAKGLPSYDYGTVGVYTTEKYIYLLYNPNTVEDHQKGEETLCNEIWVFDWEGNRIEKLVSNHRIVSFCIDESTSTVYAVIQDPDYSISEFKIIR